MKLWASPGLFEEFPGSFEKLHAYLSKMRTKVDTWKHPIINSACEILCKWGEDRNTMCTMYTMYII